MGRDELEDHRPGDEDVVGRPRRDLVLGFGRVEVVAQHVPGVVPSTGRGGGHQGRPWCAGTGQRVALMRVSPRMTSGAPNPLFGRFCWTQFAARPIDSCVPASSSAMVMVA